MLNLCCFHEDHKLIGLVKRFTFRFEELFYLVIDSNWRPFVAIFTMIAHRCCFRGCRSMMLGLWWFIWVSRWEHWSGLRYQSLSGHIIALSYRRFQHLSCILRGRTPRLRRCSSRGLGFTTYSRNCWIKVGQVRRFLLGRAD